MELATFENLWNKWSSLWLQTTFKFSNETKRVSDLCKIKDRSINTIHKNYNIIKRIMKDTYFKDSSQCPPRLNRYKRAAVIAYAIIKSNPLVISDRPMEEDVYFLKQRLAFFIAIASILQDFDEQQVKDKKIYSIFESLGTRDLVAGNDVFLMSVYKDMFYSELYNNYNVLTMANVFGLLIENVAGFDQLKTVDELRST